MLTASASASCSDRLAPTRKAGTVSSEKGESGAIAEAERAVEWNLYDNHTTASGAATTGAEPIDPRFQRGPAVSRQAVRFQVQAGFGAADAAHQADALQHLGQL
ncbi:hypothetical protein D3C72_2165650 [compost metagenome]